MTTRQMARDLQEALDTPLKIETSAPLDVNSPLCYVAVEVNGIAASDALDANDALGGIMSFAVPYEYGIINNVKLIDPDDDALVATVHVFSKTFTSALSDAAFTISAADSLNWVTSVPMTSTLDIGSAKVAEQQNWNSHYYSQARRLYFQLSTAGTPNIAAGKMPVVIFGILPAAIQKAQ